MGRAHLALGLHRELSLPDLDAPRRMVDANGGDAAPGPVGSPLERPAQVNGATRSRVPAPDDVPANRQREARELVDSFFEDLRAALAVGEQVKLSGFGNFDLRDKNKRPGRNPKTGEEIPITARRVVTFRPGQKLKARVEAYAGTRE